MAVDTKSVFTRMKDSLFVAQILLSSLFSCTMACGQSHFLFRNADSGGPIPVNAPVFDAQGVPLAGPGYLAELWGGVTADSLAPLVLIDQGGNRLFKTFASSGYVVPADGGMLAVTSVPPYGWAWLQMRAWDAQLGASYEGVAALGIGGYGESSLFYAQGGNPFDQFPEPGRLVGLESFSLRPVVPEPSTWAVLALGGMALWRTIRRRSHRRL
jgi:hypothetical protein